MSGRINGFCVVLDKDYKDEDIESTINAIKHIRGVIEVIPNIADWNDQIVASRTKIEIKQKLYDLLDNI